MQMGSAMSGISTSSYRKSWLSEDRDAGVTGAGDGRGKIPVLTGHRSWRRSCCLMLVSDCGLRLMSGSLPPKSCRSHHATRRNDSDLHIKLFV